MSLRLGFLCVVLASFALVSAFACDQADNSDGGPGDPPGGMARLYGTVSNFDETEFTYDGAGEASGGATVTAFVFHSMTDTEEYGSVTADDSGYYVMDVLPGDYVLRSYNDLTGLPAEMGGDCVLSGASPDENDEFYTLAEGEILQVDLTLTVACPG